MHSSSMRSRCVSCVITGQAGVFEAAAAAAVDSTASGAVDAAGALVLGVGAC